MEFEQLVKLIHTVSESDLTGFKYEENGMKLSMQKEKICVAEMPMAITAAPEKVTVQTENVKENEKVEAGNIVTSPLVGTFYAAPSEDADAFVTVGDTVKQGQTLAIVEAMKLMNDIESDWNGTVAEVYVENGMSVEYGQPLFRIV